MKIKFTNVLIFLSVVLFAQEEFRPYAGGGGVIKCGCYWNEDCNQSVANCTLNKCQREGKLDGHCVKNAFDFWNKSLPHDNYIEIARRFDLWFSSLRVSGGEPDPRLVKSAMDTTGLSKNQVELIRLRFLALIVPLWVGHYKPTNEPAKKGFWLHAWDSVDAKGSYIFPNGYLFPIPDELVKIGKIIQKGITSSIITGDKKHFLKAFEKIQNKYPLYSSFGRCEFPHPREHGHEFIYNDALECMESEMEPGISALFRNKNNNVTLFNNNQLILKASPNPFKDNTIISFGVVGEEITEEQEGIITIQSLLTSFSKKLWQGTVTINEQKFQNINAIDLNGYGGYVVTFARINSGLNKQIRIFYVP